MEYHIIVKCERKGPTVKETLHYKTNGMLSSSAGTHRARESQKGPNLENLGIESRILDTLGFGVQLVFESVSQSSYHCGQEYPNYICINLLRS